MEKYYARFAEIVVKVAFWALAVAVPVGALLGFYTFFQLSGLEDKVALLHSELNKVFQFLSAGQSQ